MPPEGGTTNKEVLMHEPNGGRHATFPTILEIRPHGPGAGTAGQPGRVDPARAGRLVVARRGEIRSRGPQGVAPGSENLSNAPRGRRRLPANERAFPGTGGLVANAPPHPRTGQVGASASAAKITRQKGGNL